MQAEDMQSDAGTGEGAEQVAQDQSAITEVFRNAEHWLVTRGPSVLAALVFLVVAWLVAGWMRRLVIRALIRARVDLTLAKFFGNMTKWGIIVFAVVTSMGTLGINTTSLAAMMGAAGLAVGLALQGNLGNLASGVLLLVFRPFKIGDMVIVAGQTGVVDGIDLFTTNLDTPDNRRIIVPNNAIFNGVIENQTRQPRRRAEVTVQVAYWARGEQVRETFMRVAEQVVAGTEGALKDPAPNVLMVEVHPSTWMIQVWAETPKFRAVRQALLFGVKRAIDDAQLHAGPLPAEMLISKRAKGAGGPGGPGAAGG